MQYTLGIYFRLIAVQIRSQFQYRLPFVLDVSAVALNTVLTFASLAFILQRFGSVGGWSFGEIAFLYGIVETSFGVMDMLFSGFDPQNFGRQVRLGRLDQLLLRPQSITLQVFGSEFILRRLGRIIQGFAVFLISLQLVTIHWDLLKIIYLPFVFAGMVLFFGGLFIVGATITFWTFDSIEVVNIFTYGGSEMMSYPMHIYPDWMRFFFTFILPAIFLNYYPALYFLDKPDPFHFPAFAPFLSPLAGLVVLLASLAFWNYGLGHYQSTGT